LVFAKKETKLEITGGTAGLGAPTAEYIKHVTLPMLAKFRVAKPELDVVKQGFYPRGGGIVRLKASPAKTLEGVTLLQQGTIKMVKGISIAGSLPETVAVRQADAAKLHLLQGGVNSVVDISAKTAETMSQGTSITIFEESDASILGADAIGRPGVRAEDIGKEAAESLLRSMRSGAALDRWMSDQIIPFMALAGGKSSVTVEEITGHCRTNMLACEKILGVKFFVEGNRISCDGIGFTA
jgi:RNA 3'-terminal phosphate cyclase (ATP)